MPYHKHTPNLENLRSKCYYLDGDLFYTTSHARLGWSRKDRYTSVEFENEHFMLHRLVWMFHNGLTENEIDHIDRNPNNNRIENLREVTRQQNNINSVRKDSICRGTCFHQRDNVWRAQISISGARLHLGSFKTQQEAKACYDKTAREWFGEYYSG